MLSNRVRCYSEEDLAPDKRLRANLVDLFTANEISAPRAASLMADAAAAGAPGFSKLRRLGSDKHKRRNLSRRLVKGSGWPKEYIAQVQVHYPKSKTSKSAKLPMLLPHEVIAALCASSKPEALFSRASMDPCTSSTLTKAAERLKIDPKLPLLGVSFWLDGVTCKWDRSESVDIISMGFPGLPGKWRNLRIPLCAIDHTFVDKDRTINDIMKILVWSLDACAINAHPSQRHDGLPWTQQERRIRSKSAGKAIGCSALLSQIVGDWKC